MAQIVGSEELVRLTRLLRKLERNFCCLRLILNWQDYGMPSDMQSKLFSSCRKPSQPQNWNYSLFLFGAR